MATVLSTSQATPLSSTTVSPQGVSAHPPSRRLVSLDIVRGVAMVLMAIDHVRVYSGQPAGGPTPGIFFTRWVTNYSAPIFVFLAGTGAYLYGAKLGGAAGRRTLARWLLSRGAWLIFLELTVLRFAWTFNFDYKHYSMAGVLWAIGWCMILLGGLIFLPATAIAAIGAVIVGGHNALDPHIPAIAERLSNSGSSWLWQILYFGGGIDIYGSTFIVLYSIIPWVGVMALGYAFGAVMQLDARERARWCYWIGGVAVATFLVFRAFDIYGDPRPWRPPTSAVTRANAASTASASAAPATPAQTSAKPAAARPTMPSGLKFLATTKYPASLLFLLMTLGPAILAIPLLERTSGRLNKVLVVFGRVPFFFYLLHIPLIHLAAVVVSLIRTGQISPWLFANHPTMNPPAPDGYIWSLPLLYLVWVIVVALLYIPCRWYADLKGRSRSAWLRYV